MVGWAVSAVNDRHLTIKALDQALRCRGPAPGLLPPLRSGLHVRQRRLPTRARGPRSRVQHESARQLYDAGLVTSEDDVRVGFTAYIDGEKQVVVEIAWSAEAVN